MKVLLILFCIASLALSQIPEVPADKGIPLTPDALQTVTTLKRDYEAAHAAKLLAESQMLSARNGIAAQFNRFCAKQKLDPDAYEWNEGLTAIRKKKPEKNP